MRKKLIAGAIAGAALLANALPVLGHGMGAGPNAVDPGAPNCVGLLASKHAVRFKGIANSNHVDPNVLPQGPALKDFESVHDFMHFIHDYCNEVTP